MERHNGIELDPEGAFVYYDDAQATVEALQRERDRLRANLINCSERLAAYYGDNYPAVVDARAALMPAARGRATE